MDQFPSPDLPAWVCYILVLIVGMVGARSSVKTLLADQRGYWGIANPTAILLSGVMMLDYLGETEAAQRIK